MIDELLKVWYMDDVCVDLTVKTSIYDGKILYTIPFEGTGWIHFNILREFDAIARMYGYDMYVEKNGIHFNPDT